MPDKRIRLLLLDFDGTLVDTRRANTLAYVATLREAGYALTEEEYAARYFGMRCDEFLTRLGVADPRERERLRLRKVALYPAFFDTVRLNRPLWEFCRSFRAQGGRVWIVSTGSRANIENVMRYLGIEGPSRTGPTLAAGPNGDDPTQPCDPLPHTDTAAPAAANAGIDPPIGGSCSFSDASSDGAVDGILSGAEEANGCTSRSHTAGAIGAVDGILSGAEKANGCTSHSHATGAIGAVDGVPSGAEKANGSISHAAGAIGAVDGILSGAEKANGCTSHSHATGAIGAVDGVPSGAEKANGSISHAAGAIGAVDGILSGADVARSKPFPDCFLEAMRREGCTADETLIFEDSPIGLEAARRSGAAYMRVVL